MDIDQAYSHTLNYLLEKLPMFSHIGAAAIKKDLHNSLLLDEALGHPHKSYKTIHVAGTNGKGSTSHMLAAICMQAGLKTGLYTSPHLVDFRERIRINGQMISKEWVVNFTEVNKALIEEVKPSFFEISVAMAFKAFADEKVDIAIIETGLGGRLDSTNIITPVLSVITNISLEHTDILGSTLSAIAGEKAGIIKQGVPVVVGEQHEETEKVFFEKSVLSKSPIYYADATWDIVRSGADSKYQYLKAVHKGKRKIFDLKTDLIGNYQVQNIKTALAAAEVMADIGLPANFGGAISSLSSIKKTTGLRGRWEWLQEQPAIIADVAHNPAGMQQAMQQWREVNATNKHVVVGFVKDKDVKQALSHFPADTIFYFCNANVPRALPVAELATIAAEKGITGQAFSTVEEAVSTAKNNLKTNDALLITGSFFVVGEALQALEQVQETI